MTFFVTVETRDHTQVPRFLLLLAGLSGLSCVYSGGRGGAFLLGFVLFLLLVFPGLIGRLRILGRSRHGSFSLGFVPTMIFHHSLGLDLVCGSVGQSIPLGDLLVGLSYIRTWS